MSPAWAPPLLPVVAREVQGWNEVLAFTGEPVPLGEPGMELLFRPSAPPPDETLVAVVHVNDFASPVLAAFCEFPFAELCRVELAPSAIAPLPPGLREALLGGMIAHLCSLLATKDPAFWSLSSAAPLGACKDDLPPDCQWFEVILQQGGSPSIRLRTGASIRDVVRLLDLPPFAGRPRPRSLLAAGISAPADFTIGTLPVTYRELAAIEPGSIVVMGRRASDTWMIRVGEVLCTFASTDDGWCCTNLERLPEATSGELDPGNEDRIVMGKDNGKARKLLDGLRCTLTFEVGRKTFPLSELAQWREGALIDLVPPPLLGGMEVTIRINGEAIGTGDLVWIDDRIAVRITRLVL